ncbi:MAG TPA: hypothetical protein PKA10_11210 [Selenomonadales bacterium]|nr:hypothetical protein [Selenomonadales bacterium]
MISARRAYIAVLVLVLMIIGSTALWVFYGQLPKKVPFRARQVFSVGAEYDAAERVIEGIIQPVN